MCVDVVYPTYTIACHEAARSVTSAVLHRAMLGETDMILVACIVLLPLIALALVALGSHRPRPTRSKGWRYERTYRLPVTRGRH